MQTSPASGPSLAMLTDLYELTMAYGYWKNGMVDTEAAFHLSFRKEPFQGGYAVACGLQSAVDLITNFRFSNEDTSYLGSLTGNDGAPLFDDGFLEYLRGLRLRCDLDAVIEGTVVFGQEPLMRVSGPIIDCQIVETALLNLVNFETLIATKASRIALAAEGDRVIEFGLRRAHGPNGALAASRAAYIGGCWGTSNVLAGQRFGIPVGGTQAHSWIMAFDDELAAFHAYADALPNNVVFLVDTYDSLEGVRNAVKAATRLREAGHEMTGIRLDSGDLAWLSVQAREILDDAGFENATITASNELDEWVITSLRQQDAAIDVWGVGTRLVTAYDQPALGGVYKLSAIRKPGGDWEYRIKLSEQAAKTTNPGILQVRRFEANGAFIGDMIYDVSSPSGSRTMVDPMDITRRKTFPPDAAHQDLLVPIFRGGELVYEAPPIAEVRDRTLDQLKRFYPGTTRLVNPHEYPVGLEEQLHETKLRLIFDARARLGR